MLRDLSDTFIVDPTKDIIIRLPKSQRDQKEYYLDTIKRQKETIQKYKALYNSTLDKRDELKYLKEFRDMFVGQCIAGNIKITIIQCTERIRNKRCAFDESCILRKKFDTLVKI